eukprot:COSAG06_NODE_4560_length_4145_cov_1.345032_5_plen_30_part_01
MSHQSSMQQGAYALVDVFKLGLASRVFLEL